MTGAVTVRLCRAQAAQHGASQLYCWHWDEVPLQPCDLPAILRRKRSNWRTLTAETSGVVLSLAEVIFKMHEHVVEDQRSGPSARLSAGRWPSFGLVER